MRLGVRICLGLGAVMLALIVLAQLAVFVAGAWLSTPAGQAMLHARLNRTLAQNGYQIDAPHLALVGAGHLYLPEVTIADAAGPFLHGQGVLLTLDIPALVAGHADVSLRAASLEVMRLPATRPTPPKPADASLLVPFHLADHYINVFSITRLKVDRLTLAPPVTGMALNLSPDLQASVHLKGQLISFDADGILYAEKAAEPPWLPRRIVAHGTLDAESATLDLAALNVEASAFSLSAKGKAPLATGALSLTLNGKVPDLARLDAPAGSAGMTMTIGGTAARPTIDAALTTHLDAAHGLGDIKVGLRADDLRLNPAGDLTVETSYGARTITLGDRFTTTNATIENVLTGEAPAASLSGKLAIDRKSRLATGTATLAADLGAYRDLLKVPVAGKLSAALDLTGAQERQGLVATVTATGIQDGSIGARRAVFTLDIADLKARIVNAITLQAQGLTVPKATIDTLSATLTPAGKDAYAAKLTATGKAGRNFTLSSTATLSGTSLQTGAVRDLAATLVSSGGTVILHGALDPARIALALTAAKFPLGALPLGLPTGAGEVAANGDLSLHGPLNAPQLASQLAFSPRTGRRFILSLKSTIAAGKATLVLAGQGQGIDRLSGQVSMPVSFTLKPFSVRAAPDAPLAGSLDADLNIATLAAGFVPPAIGMSGTLRAAMKVSGTLVKPETGGTFGLTGGAFAEQASGVALNDITLRGALSRDKVTIGTLSADDRKGGTLSGTGTAGLGADHALDFKLHAANLDLLRGNDIARGTLSADLNLSGHAKSYALKGKITAGPTDVTVPENLGGAIPQLNIVTRHEGQASSPLLAAVRLDIALHAPERIFVRGMGLDAEFSGDLQANGTLAAPLVTGTLSSRRGRFDAFGRSFSLDRANLRFQGAVPPSPYLDISASAPATDITATIALTGPVTMPAIALSSTPALPQDEVLSQLLFGKSVSSITPFQAIQIAQTLQQFSGKSSGGFDPLGKLRSAAGLDDLSVGQSTAGATTLGAGKYLTNKVYVQAQAGADQKSSTLTVQYDLTSHLKVQSTAGQEQTGGGVLWQYDY